MTTLTNSIAPAIEELERFYTFTNKRFSLKLPDTVTITIQTRGRRKSTLGWFGGGFWVKEKEPVSEINICAETLKTGNPYETLAHEMVHYFNFVNKIKDCAGLRHNKKFKVKAEEMLMEVTSTRTYGCGHTKPTEAFDKMVKDEFKSKPDCFKVFRNEQVGKRYVNRMRRYQCSCGKSIYSAVEDLDATCNLCEQSFDLV